MWERLFLEMQQSSNAPDVTYKKLIVTSLTSFKVIYVDKPTDNRIVKAYDIADAIRFYNMKHHDLKYVNTNSNPPFDFVPDRGGYYDPNYDPPKLIDTPQIWVRFPVRSANHPPGQELRAAGEEHSTFPVYALADGETATDETATQTITIPYEEEPICPLQTLSLIHI